MRDQDPLHIHITKHIRTLRRYDDKLKFKKVQFRHLGDTSTNTTARSYNVGGIDSGVFDWLEPVVPYPPEWDDSIPGAYLEGFIAWFKINIGGNDIGVDMPNLISFKAGDIDEARRIYGKVTWLERIDNIADLGSDVQKESAVIKLQWDLTTIPGNFPISKFIVKKHAADDITDSHRFELSAKNKPVRCRWDNSKNNPTDASNQTCQKAIDLGAPNEAELGPNPFRLYRSPCNLGWKNNWTMRCWDHNGAKYDMLNKKWKKPDNSDITYLPDGTPDWGTKYYEPDPAYESGTSPSTYVDREVISGKNYIYELYAVNSVGREQRLLERLIIKAAGDMYPPRAYDIFDGTDFVGLTATQSKTKSIDLKWNLPQFDYSSNTPPYDYDNVYINGDIAKIFIYRMKESDLSFGFPGAFERSRATHGDGTVGFDLLLDGRVTVIELPPDSESYSDLVVEGVSGNIEPFTFYVYRIGFMDASGNIDPYLKAGSHEYTGISYDSSFPTGWFIGDPGDAGNLIDNGEMVNGTTNFQPDLVGDLSDSDKLPNWEFFDSSYNGSKAYWYTPNYPGFIDPVSLKPALKALHMGGTIRMLNIPNTIPWLNTKYFPIFSEIGHLYYLKAYLKSFDPTFLLSSSDKMLFAVVAEYRNSETGVDVHDIILNNISPGLDYYPITNEWGEIGSFFSKTGIPSLDWAYASPFDPVDTWVNILGHPGVPDEMRIVIYTLFFPTSNMDTAVCDLSLFVDAYDTPLQPGSTYRQKQADGIMDMLNVMNNIPKGMRFDEEGFVSESPLNPAQRAVIYPGKFLAEKGAYDFTDYIDRVSFKGEAFQSGLRVKDGSGSPIVAIGNLSGLPTCAGGSGSSGPGIGYFGPNTWGMWMGTVSPDFVYFQHWG